ncbi:MAG: hypothetical protein WAW41_11640, partial [Methylobacter sp.]
KEGENMAFSKSLYYPWIDVRDEAWLKSAALYWDMIQTIVPEALDRPYSTKTARQLQDEGILVPLRVRSDLREIEGLTQDVLTYLRSQEGMELLTGANRNHVYLHPDKLPNSVRHLARMHPEKISHEIRYMLEESGLSRPSRGGFLEVDDEFANFYMTLLATRLSESIGAGLVTSSSLPHRLSLKAKTDSQMTDIIGSSERHGYEYQLYRKGRTVRRELAQGMLVELMLEEIAVDPATPIERIIEYRKGHSPELGRFRAKVGQLTSSLPEDAPLQAMRQQVSDLYVNEVKPAIDDLKKSLTSGRNKWLTSGWMCLACFSVGSSSVLLGMGLATANALLVGAGISLVGSGILYNVAKRDSLRANPYSYLMSLQKEMP